MNNLKFSHLIQTVKTSPKGVTTLYFFEVWVLDVTYDLFKAFNNSTMISKVPNLKIIRSPFHVADHCQYLIPQEQKELIIPECPRIRVSMSTLVDIQVGLDHALLIQKGCLKPFGGGLHYIDHLPVASAISDDETSLDLRMTIDHSEVSNLTKWFLSKEGRELSPERELHEELVLENTILTPAQWEVLKKTF